MPSLTGFHPVIQQWFRKKYKSPTDIQSLVWEQVKSGQHLLITAPTGSGKTLAAFLWAINQLVTGVWAAGQVRVLYISPLKALNNDVQKNLLTPLKELKQFNAQAGRNTPSLAFPDIRVETRSGDTLPAARRRLLSKPPEILITTPESLNLLLASPKSRLLLTGLATVILDEIHAVAAGKRGTHLITAVERLVLLAGELQRIALSATVKPLAAVAEFVGGYRYEPETGSYSRRPVHILCSQVKKTYALSVCSVKKSVPQAVPVPGSLPPEDSTWDGVVRQIKATVERQRATLVFTNSRRVAEKLTRLLNGTGNTPLAYAHHGSLAKEIRRLVEERLKNGELKALVATSSLELGIDVGELDHVILVQTPFSLSAGIQRIGRAGHGVGETSRASLLTIYPRDLLNAAVLARAVRAHDIEPLAIPHCPLDILAQVILAMTGVEEWDYDDLYDFIRTCAPYHTLKQEQYALVIEMLTGRYADSRIRELRPRLVFDRLTNRLKAGEGVLRLLYLSGGTIPDRGYFLLRVQGSQAKIGELDEEFVWERSIGDIITLGAQSWKIQAIDHQAVEVLPVRENTGMSPFWKADLPGRPYYFSEQLLMLLQELESRLVTGTQPDSPAYRDCLQWLVTTCFMEQAAATELLDYLLLQKSASQAALPHRYQLLIEHFHDPLNVTDSKQVVIHTLWGARVNRALAIASAEAWEEAYGYPLAVFQDDDCLLINLPHDFDGSLLFSLVTPDNLERLLRRRLERTGLFGAQFRENAARALLLPRASFKQRIPLWLNRLRAKKLLKAVLRYENFPILLETWRTCLQEVLDVDNLLRLLAEIRQGIITVRETVTKVPSPFAAQVIWQQTNKYMYEDDTPLAAGASRLKEDLLESVLFTSELRPRLPGELIQELERKLKRTYPGYAPESADELALWVRERVLIPLPEWEELLQCRQEEGGPSPVEQMAELQIRQPAAIYQLLLPGASVPVLIHLERIGPLLAALPPISSWEELCRAAAELQPLNACTEAYSQALGICLSRQQPQLRKLPGHPELQAERLARLIGEWLHFYGPLPPDRLARVFGLEQAVVTSLLNRLLDEKLILFDYISSEARQPEVCDLENCSRLLRLWRRRQQVAFMALPLDTLPLFLATYQGLLHKADSLEGLQSTLDKLFGYPAQAALWETEFFPARINTYYTSWLDTLLQQSTLTWLGCGRQKLTFCFKEDVPLFTGPATAEAQAEVKELLSGTTGLYTFWDLQRATGLTTPQLTTRLWQLAWAGLLTNDQYSVIRKGLATRFAAPELPGRHEKAGGLPGSTEGVYGNRLPPFSSWPAAGRPVSGSYDFSGSSGFSGRSQGQPSQGFNRWQLSRPLTGHWLAVHTADEQPEDDDALSREARVRSAIGQLLNRYGILFRELLEHELKGLQWGSIFKSLRLMELAGEILTGHFFRDIPGVQFASHAAFRLLKQPLAGDAIYWMNAADPASPCGLKLAGLKQVFPALPKRLAANHLVFHGNRLALVSTAHGLHLDIYAEPGSPHLARYLDFFKTAVNRDFQPRNKIKVATINKQPAAQSPYLAPFLTFGFTTDFTSLILRGKY